MSMWTAAPGLRVRRRIAVGNSSRSRPIHRAGPLLRWGLHRSVKRPGTPRWVVLEGNSFIHNSTWGNTMRRVIVRFLAIAAVLGGVVFTGAGVAVANQERPVGGDNTSAPPPCGAGDLDFEHGCFLGWGRFFK